MASSLSSRPMARIHSAGRSVDSVLGRNRAALENFASDEFGLVVRRPPTAALPDLPSKPLSLGALRASNVLCTFALADDRRRPNGRLSIRIAAALVTPTSRCRATRQATTLSTAASAGRRDVHSALSRNEVLIHSQPICSHGRMTGSAYCVGSIPNSAARAGPLVTEARRPVSNASDLTCPPRRAREWQPSPRRGEAALAHLTARFSGGPEFGALCRDGEAAKSIPTG